MGELLAHFGCLCRPAVPKHGTLLNGSACGDRENAFGQLGDGIAGMAVTFERQFGRIRGPGDSIRVIITKDERQEMVSYPVNSRSRTNGGSIRRSGLMRRMGICTVIRWTGKAA